jgi:hypothetical protein
MRESCNPAQFAGVTGLTKSEPVNEIERFGSRRPIPDFVIFLSVLSFPHAVSSSRQLVLASVHVVVTRGVIVNSTAESVPAGIALPVLLVNARTFT